MLPGLASSTELDTALQFCLSIGSTGAQFPCLRFGSLINLVDGRLESHIAFFIAPRYVIQAPNTPRKQLSFSLKEQAERTR